MTQTTETRSLSVFVAPGPMAPRVASFAALANGRTVAALLAEAVNADRLPLEDVDRVVVYLNGELLEREEMLDHVPGAGDLVNVAVMPLGGGGGGGNKALATVLTIALIALTVWTGGAAGPLAGSNLFVRAGVAAAVQIGGSLAIRALTAPGAQAAKFDESNSSRALEGATNGFRLRQPMPLRLGRHRAAFDLAARPYTQTVGDDVWLHVLFGVHYGPCTVEEIKIGETLLSAYPAQDVEIEYALTPGPRQFATFPGIVEQENLSDELEDSVAEVHTSEEAERIELDFAFPGGIHIITNKGKTEEQHVHLHVLIRPAGTLEAYQPAPLPAASGPGGAPLAPGSVYLQMKTNDTVRRTVSFTPPSPGAWDVQVTKIAPVEPPNSTLEDTTYWTAIRAIRAGAPILDETLSVIGLRIRSNDDLNGNLPTISGVVTPIVPVFDGSDWDAEAPSSNALALARWLVTGPAAATPLTPDQIDVSCEDLFGLVPELELEGAIGIVEEIDQDEALKRLGRLGRFSTFWNGQRLCFVSDGEKVGPRQVFTGRNAAGYRYRRTFPDELHGVIVEFQTLDETGPWDEVIAYAEGYSKETAQLFETHRLGFMCEGERAVREGLLYLARRILLVEVHEWQAGEDAVATTLGDRVLVRHMSSVFGLAEATVDHRIWSGGVVVGIRLDEVVEMVEGETYAIDFRRADSVIRGLEVNTVPGLTRTLMFAAPHAAADAPEKGDLLAFGRTEEVSEDLEIVDVDAGEDGMITFRAVRYLAEEMAAAEGGDLPEFESGLSPRSSAPIPRIITAFGSPDGAIVTFDIDPKRGALVDGFAVRWRLNGENELGQLYPWQALPAVQANARSVTTPPPPLAVGELDETGEFHPDVAVDVEIRTIVRSGAMSNPATASGISCIRGVPDVAGFIAEGVIREAPDGSSYPVIAVLAAPRVDGVLQDLVVQIRASDTSTGDDWTAAGPPLSAAFPIGDLTAVLGGRIYDVRARWRTRDNWVGDWATEFDVEVPAGGLIASGLAGFDGSEILALLAAAAGVVGEVQTLAEGVLANAVRIVEERDALVEIGFLPDGRAVNVGIVDETTARIEGETAILESLDVLYLQVGNAEAAISTEAILRSDGDSAEAALRELLAVRVGDAEAAIVSEATARANENEATAILIEGLTANLASASAAIASESTVRASADTALTSNVSALSSTVGGFSATLSTHSSTLATLDGRTQAKFEIVAAAGGDPAYAKLLATGSGSAIVLAATELALYNVSGGTILRALRLIGGQAFFGAPVSVDIGSYRLTIGPGFGASSNLVFWYGLSSIAVSSMTKANAIWAFANDGLAYFGGSDLTGQLGGTQFSIAVSTVHISAGRSGAGNVTTGTVTATASGATGSVSYSWVRLSSTPITANAPNNNATTFSAFVGLGQEKETGFAVYAQDSTGKTAMAVVNVLITEFS